MAAPQGNTYARKKRKSESEKLTGKGRVTLDLGDLKPRVESAASAAGMLPTHYMRAAIAAALSRDGQ